MGFSLSLLGRTIKQTSAPREAGASSALTAERLGYILDDVRTTKDRCRNAAVSAPRPASRVRFGMVTVNFSHEVTFSPTQKSAEEQRGCAAAAALWLSAYMASIGAAISTNACARARPPRLCEGAMCFAAKSPRLFNHSSLSARHSLQEPALRRTRV